MHNSVMLENHNEQDRFYVVITDGVDLVGVLTFADSLADAVAYADAMEVEGNCATVEICL
jgi:hypothetical protein